MRASEAVPVNTNTALNNANRVSASPAWSSSPVMCCGISVSKISLEAIAGAEPSVAPSSALPAIVAKSPQLRCSPKKTRSRSLTGLSGSGW